VLPVKQIEQMGVEVHRSDRGGELTYHGPGQLVSYPILNLRTLNIGVKKYISLLEQVIINTLSDYGISSERKKGYPGVWTIGQKIASIGVSVKNGITMHGSALNVSTDLDSFSMIVPCGISDVVVTSMEKVLNKPVNMQEVIDRFTRHFGDVYSVNVKTKTAPTI
jgi:lipoyl(octanoyl) transferase